MARLTSRMGFSQPDRIVVQGRDFCGELLGRVTLSGMAWLEITGRMPTEAEAAVLDALLVTLVEHGPTPMAIAARLTYLGAPESLQAAVAAGLCGMGTTFAGTAEGAARLLQEAPRDGEVEAVAARIVAEHGAARRAIPGIGHPVHKPIDPRTPVLFAIAARHGFSGRHVALMQAISAAAERASGKALPVNATGAIGAVATELGLDWRLCRGLAVIGRCVGLVGHIAEEIRQPMAREIWSRVEREVAEANLEAERQEAGR